jgi:hypothetical protein
MLHLQEIVAVKRALGPVDQRLADMKVNHGGLDAGMAQKLLNHRKRDTGLHEMGGETMSQGVRRNPLGELGFKRGIGHDIAKRTGGVLLAVPALEEPLFRYCVRKIYASSVDFASYSTLCREAII